MVAIGTESGCSTGLSQKKVFRLPYLALGKYKTVFGVSFYVSGVSIRCFCYTRGWLKLCTFKYHLHTRSDRGAEALRMGSGMFRAALVIVVVCDNDQKPFRLFHAVFMV